MTLRIAGLITHVFGFTMWIGSLFASFELLAATAGTRDEAARKRTLGLARRNLLAMDVGMTVAITGGLMLLLPSARFYLKQGWMHGKLTAVLLLIAIHVYLRITNKRLQRGAEVAVPRALVPALMLLFLGILVCVLGKPF